MAKKTIACTATATLVAAGFLASTLAASASRSEGDEPSAPLPKASPKASHPFGKGQAIPQPVPVEPPYRGPRPMVVRTPKEFPASIRALHQPIADRMTNARLAAPAFRLKQFRWLKAPKFRLDGWHGAILNVQPTPAGHLVTLVVTPSVTSTVGASTTILSSVHEQYLVSPDGRVTFLKSLDGPDAASEDYITD